MKKVVKVNIGNLAFTLNEDAFDLLNRYLDDLNRHYKNKPNGFEIVEGIEERIAELFAEKCGADNIVSAEVVNEVTAILGRPDDIDQESEPSQGGTRPSASSAGFIPRRLYRNPDNRFLGGVLGGLGAYFGVDPVLFRLVYAVSTLALFFAGMGGFVFMFFLYIVLWIVVPEARTVEQKCSMYGELPDISHIQRRVADEANKAGRSIRRAGQNSQSVVSDIFGAIAIAIGVILIIAGIAGIIFLTAFFLGFEVIGGVMPVNIIDYINLGTVNSLWIKICGLCVLFIPFIGLLMAGVQMVFRLQRGRRFRPGLLLAIVWWIAFFGLIALGGVASRGYWEDYRSENPEPLKFKGNTLYIKYESATPIPLGREVFDADLSESTLLWYDGAGKDPKIVTFPHIRLIRQSQDDSSRISTVMHTFGNTRYEAVAKTERSLLLYELRDSLLIIHDNTYTKTKKWDGTISELKLYIPENTKVLVTSPVKHNFEDVVRFSRRYHFHWCDID
jgi:phage shock protein PspC (stress-responsive transcriptional regulator)